MSLVVANPQGGELQIKPSAVKEIERLPRREDRRRIVARIQALAEDPRSEGATKLSGREQYRVRQGSYRIGYSVDDEERIVLVVKVGHRRDVYRQVVPASLTGSGCLVQPPG